jgi:hypothetical protein
MGASEAFQLFVTCVLIPAKARRLAALASSKKGQAKSLESLCHSFAGSIRTEAIHSRDYSPL